VASMTKDEREASKIRPCILSQVRSLWILDELIETWHTSMALNVSLMIPRTLRR